MKSAITDTLPPKVRRSLTKLGVDLATARKKRNLTAVMMAERLGVAKSTYLRVEKGDPTVSMGVYAMALFVLGFGDALGEICRAINRQRQAQKLCEAHRVAPNHKLGGGRSCRPWIGIESPPPAA